MKLNKLFLMGAIALGLVACNKNEDNPEVSKGNTYAGLTISVNRSGGGTRAQTDNVGKSEENTIATIDLLSTGGNKNWIESNAAVADWGTATSPGAKFWSGGTAEQPIYSVAPWLTTAGPQTMAVMLNKGTITADIATAAAAVYGEGTANAAANNATITALSTAGKFVMTSPALAKTIAAGKSFDAVKGGAAEADNVFALDVERVVCQGMVKKNAALANAAGALGTVDLENLRFSAANGATKTYLFKNNAGDRKMADATPFAYAGYKSAIDAVSKDYAAAAAAPELYRLGGDATTVFGGESPYAAKTVNASDVTPVTGTGIYFLENSMPATADNLEWSYNRNAYAKVYTVFTPTKVWDVDGATGIKEVEWANRSTAASATFYKGAQTGRLYVSADAAKRDLTAPNQKSYMYKDGKTVYRTLWNRLVTDGKTVNGNTRRNNIYLLTIDSFAGLGANYDPNDPQDPNIPKPTPTDNPDEPGTPPVDPPVDKQETYMRITATVLPWNVVDRGVILE